MATHAVSPEELDSLRDHVDDCAACGAALLSLVRRTVPAASEVWSEVPAGTQIGRFTLQQVLGSGNMGTVFTAWDPQLDRTVAIKVLRAGRDSARDAERLVREAKAMARVRHPNVVTVYDVGQDQDVVFVAMEQVRGTTLRARLDDRSLPLALRLDWLVQIAHALGAIHAAGLVHRDLKPDNVFVESVTDHGRGSDRVVIGDFGLAAAEAPAPSEREELATGTRSAGTPAYMAPEQLRGEPLDARADIFAFGVTAWQVVTGARPFAGKTVAELLASIERGPSPMPASTALPAGVAEILARCVHHDRAQRPSSIDEVRRALEITPRSPRMRLLALSAAAVAVLAVVALGGLGDRDERRVSVCDPDAQPRWESTRAGWLARSQQLSPFVRDAVLAHMDRRALAWSREAPAACRRDLLARHAWQLCRTRVEEIEQRVLDVAVEQLWPDDQPFLRTLERLALPAYCTSSEAAEDAVALSALPADEARAAVADGLGWLARADAYADLHAPQARDEALAAATRIAARVAPSPLDGEIALAHVLLRPPAEPAKRIAALKEVVATAERSGRASLIARAWLSLAGYAAHALDAASVDAALTQADWAITRLEDPPRLRVRWLVADGGRAWARGDQVAAKTSFAAAAALAREHGVMKQATQLSVAALARFAGDDRKAIAVYRAFLDDPEFLRRESAETLINIEASLAELLYGQGDFAEAQRAIERAMLRARTVLVPNHPTQIENEIIAASILLERGDKAGALALAEPALAKARVAFGPDHVLVGTCLRRFAQVLIASERVDEGVAAVEQAIRIFDQRLGRRSGRSIDARSQLAEAYRRKNELERSAKLYAELLADAEAAYGAAHPMWAQLSSEHATVLAALDRADEARALLERAIPLLADGPPDLLASAKFELAKLVEADDHGRAITLASEAEVALGALPSTADKHATVRTWLARHVRRAIAR